jgi:acyl-CoA reductase-like NAD-dependent aldehyde dehydrogenase
MAGGMIQCAEPASRRSLGAVPVDCSLGVNAAVRRCREAQRAWARTSFATRRAVLRLLLKHVLDHAEELCELVVRDSGKTREHALMGDIWPVCEKLRWTLAHGERHLRPERVSSGLLVHKRASVEFHPLGVIGAIVAWNYPFQNMVSPAITAVMAGNGIVIKPSEWVAWSASRFAEMLGDVLDAAGHSRDLVALVQGGPETGAELIGAGIDGLVFIGSVGNGRAVLAAAAQTITPVVLELGGNDPFIVCEDADLERAAQAAMAGCFINAGQNCVAAERLLVLDGIYDAFEARVAQLVAALRQGDTRASGRIDVGAIGTPTQLELIERLVTDAVRWGARVLVGGHRSLTAHGEFFAPTLLTDVTPEMEIMREETFGPVMVLCRVRDDEDAVRVANDTSFGLSSSVFSRDRARARRIAARLHVGMTAVNDFGGIVYMAQGLPFGGVKASGYGRMNGRDGLRGCCYAKSVLEDRTPLRLASRMPPAAPHTFERLAAAIRLVYGHSANRRARAAARLIRAAVQR